MDAASKSSGAVPQYTGAIHNNAGQNGLEKSIDRVGDRAWWAGCTKDVKEWLDKCATGTSERTSAIKSIPVGRPLEMWAMDFAGPL